MSKKDKNYCYVVLYHEDEDWGFGDADRARIMKTAGFVKIKKDDSDDN